MRPTKQFRVGTTRFLDRLKKSIVDSTIQQAKVILLPTAVPQRDIVINGKNQRAYSRKVIGDIFSAYSYISTEFVKEDCFGVPEIERFKWQEACLFPLANDGALTDESDAQCALERYEQLAKAIINEDID